MGRRRASEGTKTPWLQATARASKGQRKLPSYNNIFRRPSHARIVFHRYRLLFVIYGVGMVVGLREFYLARRSEPVDWFSDQWAAMTEIVAEVNPGDPDTDFLEGVQSMVHGDGPGLISHFEEALSADVKHNEFLLRDYAQHLLDMGGDWRQVNAAVNRWRENHPFSDETLILPLGTGPRNRSEASLLLRDLRRVAWIGNAELKRHQAGWRAHLSFRPAQRVDVREAVAAVSILAVPESDRYTVTVTCRTLTDCTASRKRGR